MSKHGNSSMSHTFVAGSEEDFDVICDPCNNDGQRVQANGHCIDCNENMCVSCIKFHKKLAAVKDHVIKDKSILTQSQQSRTKAKRAAEDKDPLTDRCPKHPDELIKFYCNSHHTLGCSDCVPLDHRSCKDILYIKDVSGGVANSEELAKIQEDLHMLIAGLTSTQSRTKRIKQTMSENYSQLVADVSLFKKDIIDMLDRFENEILERASLMNEEKINALDNIISACKNEIEKTDELLADIEYKMSMNRNNQLFILMKNAQSRIMDSDGEAEQLCYKSRYARLSFQPDEHLKNILSTLTSLGEMILVSQTKNVKAAYKDNINVKLASDSDECAINGFDVLSDGRLAIADAQNMSVKLVDPVKRTADEQIKFGDKPLDLTRFTDGKIAVTLKGKRYIQVLSVSPALSKSHTIAVPGVYHGIVYIPDTLILVCRDPTSAVHICDMTGAVLQQIETDSTGNKLFTKASRIAISPDHGVIYVSDVIKHTVVCLTIDGKLISRNRYASNMLKRPVGIAVDDGGSVYVCSEGTNTVNQLSPNGRLLNILLDNRKDGIVWPRSIAYRSGHLYVSRNSDETSANNVMVYRLV